jgi:hypothetical protein
MSLKTGQYDRGLADFLDQPVYDTAVLKNSLGAYQFRLFQVAKGGTGPSGEVKNLDLTNVKLGGQVPQTQKWKIHAVRVGYSAHAQYTTMIPIYDLLSHSVLELVVDGKDVLYQKPLGDAFGLTFAAEIVPSISTPLGILEMAQQRFTGIDKINRPIELPAGTVFEWDLTLLAPSDASLDTDRVRVEMATEYLRANA